MKKIVLFTSICMASGLLLANIYTSIVDATSWGADIPGSIAVARQYFKVANPGDFFRIFSPVNQVLGIVALLLFWKSSSSIRIYLGIALVLYLLAEGMTFGYFYPRNAILFKDGELADVELLKSTWSEWNSMNWVRSGVLLIGIIFSSLSLDKIYSSKK